MDIVHLAIIMFYSAVSFSVRKRSGASFPPWPFSNPTVSRNIVCKLCNGYFKNSRDLDGHINSKHLKIKPHTCATCGKGFAYAQSLHSHMLTHTRLAQMQ